MSDLNSVVVLGEALLDLFPDGAVLGGAPFNLARNLAALGAAPLMVTRVGVDAAGESIAAEFVRFGMDTGGLQRDPQRATGVVHVRMEGQEHRFEIGADSAWDALDSAELVRSVEAARPAWICFGTLAQRDPLSRTAIRAGLACTKAQRFLDLNLRDGPDNRALAEASLALADVVKVNKAELEALLGWFGTPGHPAPIEGLVERFDLQTLLITRGADGWACFDASERRWLEGRAPAEDVIDTVGAGDAFSAVFLLGRLRQWPLALTLQRAGEFASAMCSFKGAVDPSLRAHAEARTAWA
ncbi:PfkB family carbohydrate kinase [Roseateles toxinivorans]|uniref:Fructokinase n=1 Tax=Roseateles toxinivorans TaxID=270368 RepID=A0A4R6QS94_9BURK|nr:PfkB family carbohydrate kinase [Roseateles toxinivorans]TDP74394.1 fructokinase [Roseateles toxinivorans]